MKNNHLYKRQLILFFNCCVVSLVMAQGNELDFSFTELNNNSVDEDMLTQQIKSFDNTIINYYQFNPVKGAIAKLIFVHGGGAHSKLGYFKLAKILRDSFCIETILVDLRGHGKSEGQRGDCPNVKSIYKDISIVIRNEKKDFTRPIYLGGHSSGGGLILNYKEWKRKEKIDGFVFVSPELGYKSNTAKENRLEFAKVKFWKFVLNGITLGALMQHSKAVIFNYPQNVIEKNPLILSDITVNMSKALTPKKPAKYFKKVTCPIALFVGSQDELFNPESVLSYASLPTVQNDKSIAYLIKKENHLSILNIVGNDIGKTIKIWLKKSY